MADLPGWGGDTDDIRCRYTAPDFPAGIALVDAVAVAAEAAGHHPDIDIRWREVLFVLATHSEGGVTAKDVELAGPDRRPGRGQSGVGTAGRLTRAAGSGGRTRRARTRRSDRARLGFRGPRPASWWAPPSTSHTRTTEQPDGPIRPSGPAVDVPP